MAQHNLLAGGHRELLVVANTETAENIAVCAVGIRLIHKQALYVVVGGKDGLAHIIGHHLAGDGMILLGGCCQRKQQQN